MGHEIFIKIFDGPRNIFLCSPLVTLIFKLRESAQTPQTGYQGDLKKVRHVK